jgi:hypothetical protein
MVHEAAGPPGRAGPAVLAGRAEAAMLAGARDHQAEREGASCGDREPLRHPHLSHGQS